MNSDLGINHVILLVVFFEFLKPS